MKRLYILLLVALFAAFATACAKKAVVDEPKATTDPTVYITVRSGEEPREYEAVVAAANNPGIAGYNLALKFDKAMLTPVSVKEGEALADGIVFSSNLMGAAENKIAAMNAVTTVWAASGDEAGNGTLYSVAFRAAPEATGQTELSLTSRGIGDAEENPVDFMLTSAVINFDDAASDKATQNWHWLIWLAILLLVGITAINAILKRKGKNYGYTRGWKSF